MSVLYATFPGIFAVMAAGVKDAFGPLHYQANFGLLFTVSLAYSFVIMILTKVGTYISIGLNIILKWKFINNISDFCYLFPTWLHRNVSCCWWFWCSGLGSGWTFPKISHVRKIQTLL